MKTNSSKRNLIVGIAFMVLAVGVAAGTYAYYQTVITGTVSGTVLAWDCVNGSSTSGALNATGLKPGVSGSLGTLKAYSTNFKTDITFVINAGSNVPTNIKFYKDSAHSSGSAITLGTSWTVTGVAKGSTGTSQAIYFDWPIGTAGETPLSTSSNLTMTINYTITCKQSSAQ